MSASGARLAVGSIVHYVLPNGNYKGEHRPAIVVKIWGEPAANPVPMVQLQVFTDSSNDFPTGIGSNGLLWATSVRYDEGQSKGTWHWPEEV